jgi:CRP-like cAMP-binding protein
MAICVTKNDSNCTNCASKDLGVFADLDQSILNQLSDAKVSNLYKKGQTLFVEGNPSFGLYCISEGNIKITKLGVQGKENIVRLASAGDILGHRSIFTQEYYSATATALENTRVCFIDKKYIMRMVQENASVAHKIIQRLGRDLGASEEKVASFSQKNVLERVAELLLLLKEGHGEKIGDDWKINLKLTREEMASYLGTATETLIRCISELKEEGLISQSGKHILIKDEAKLLDFAGLTY